MTLKPSKEARTKWDMNRIVTFDIEAYDWVNPIALGMYSSRTDLYREWLGEDCTSKFTEEILRRKWDNTYFVAHNGGNYDFIPIVQELAVKDDIELEILTRGANNSPFFIRIDPKDERKPRYLQDSYALMPRTLKSLSESFTDNFEKLDFDVEKLDSLENMSQNDIDEMREYLERDCKTLYEVLDSFTDIVLELSDGNCGCQITMGSTAMAVYRTTYMPDISIEPCYQPSAEQNPEECFRESYFGGRTEVYKMHGKNLKHYDINSLYPYVYSQNPIPIGGVFKTGNDFPFENDEYGGVVKIRGNVPESCYYPVLPVRKQLDSANQSRIIFPTGNIEGWYMATEVRYALEVGALENIEVLDGYASKYGAPFKTYGERLYQMKNEIDKEKQPGRYKIVKLLLNSFYGKFGMEREHMSIVSGPVSKDFQTGKTIITDELANLGIMGDTQESRAGYILPRIASNITANARIELHKWFTKVDERGGNIWYCDTDSIVTDIDLEESTELGGMDLEGELKEGVFLAPKVYAEKYSDNGELIKTKGMRDPKLSFRDFKKAYEDNDPSLIKSEWPTPMGFVAGMKESDGEWFKKTNQNRSLRQFDQKRLHEGNDSKPLEI